MSIPFPALSDSQDQENRWREYRDSLYLTIQTIAQEKLGLLISVFFSAFALNIIILGVSSAIFGVPPAHNAPDPAAPWRALLSSIGNVYYVFITIGMVNVVRLWMKGGPDAGWDTIFHTSLGHLLRMIIAYLLYIVGCIVGVILLIIPGIWFALTYQLAPTALAANPSLGIMDAFRRSRSLTTGNRWQIFVTSITTTIRFWWRHGGKWSILVVVSALAGYVFLTAATTGIGERSVLAILFSVIKWTLAASGIVGIIGFILTGMYTSVIVQYTFLPILFFSLNEPQTTSSVSMKAGVVSEEAPPILQ